MMGNFQNRSCNEEQKHPAMEELQDTAKRLLVRSQEAILQLDLCIQRQQRLYECGFCEQSPSIDSQTSVQQYHSYLAQLNSLYIRTQHLRDKIQGNECPHHAVDQDSIHQLLSEYQTITSKLNEFTTQSINGQYSPASDSTKSASSFKPRPLKILSRNNLYATSSPTKKSKPISIKAYRPDKHIIIACKESPHSHARSTSLPGSPKICSKSQDIQSTANRFLRGAKSCDIGLNKKKVEENNRLNFFKDKQRLSISFFDDNDYSSDEETVISSSPPVNSTQELKSILKSAPLRRYKSHESILSTRELNAYIPAKPRNFAQLLSKTSSKPLAEITSVDFKQIDSFQLPPCESNKTKTSKDLLSKIVEKSSSGKHSKNWLASLDSQRNPLFSVWKRFNHQTIVTSEIGVRATKADIPSGKRIMLRSTRPDLRTKAYDSCSSLIIGPNGSKFVTRAKEPELSYKISHDALNEALNTDFRFEPI